MIIIKNVHSGGDSGNDKERQWAASTRGRHWRIRQQHHRNQGDASHWFQGPTRPRLEMGQSGWQSARNSGGPQIKRSVLYDQTTRIWSRRQSKMLNLKNSLDKRIHINIILINNWTQDNFNTSTHHLINYVVDEG